MNTSERLTPAEVELCCEWRMMEDYDDWMRLAGRLHDRYELPSGSTYPLTASDYRLLSYIAIQRAREHLPSEDDYGGPLVGFFYVCVIMAVLAAFSWVTMYLIKG